MKKILFIITKPDLGGAQRHVVDMNTKLISSGWNSQIITGNGTPEEFDIFKNFAGTDFKVNRYLEREINPIKDFLALILMIIHLLAEKPDIVSLHCSKAGIIGRIACLITRKRCIFTAHGCSFREEGWRKNLLEDFFKQSR